MKIGWYEEHVPVYSWAISKEWQRRRGASCRRL